MARKLNKQLQKTGVAAQLLLSRPLQLTSQPTTADSTQWAGTSALPPIRASDLKTGMENQLQFYRHHQYLAPDIKFALAFSIFSHSSRNCWNLLTFFTKIKSICLDYARPGCDVPHQTDSSSCQATVCSVLTVQMTAGTEEWHWLSGKGSM